MWSAECGPCPKWSPSLGAYWGYIGIMENKMETTIVYWGYIGIVENQMETTMFGSVTPLALRVLPLTESCGGDLAPP